MSTDVTEEHNVSILTVYGSDMLLLNVSELCQSIWYDQSTKQKVLGRTNRLLSLIRHGPH
jgi:hypothetical protein